MTTYSEHVTITRSQLTNVDSLCAGIVTAAGEEGPCCKPATAIVYDAESASVWPASS